jgi:hypothetical protein
VNKRINNYKYFIPTFPVGLYILCAPPVFISLVSVCKEAQFQGTYVFNHLNLNGLSHEI